MSRSEGHSANPTTHNFSEQQIAPGMPVDKNVESDPKNTNRTTSKVAPMPENPGKSIKEQSLSGGGLAVGGSHSSGKGGMGKENTTKGE